VTTTAPGFTLVRDFDATPEDLWSAWTDPNDETGDAYPTGGVYLEVQPFERLVFTWGDPDAAPDDAPVATVTLAPNGGRTRMTFELRGVEGRPGDGFFYDGWDSALDVLVDYIAQDA
jgi:uncharacterized protein YndB with AHSA1/START domain